MKRRRLSTMAEDVRRGLSAMPKTLPPYLFYDDAGSRLYEQITAMLQHEGINVTRRTVAKYREQLGIASSVQRRREKNLRRG